MQSSFLGDIVAEMRRSPVATVAALAALALIVFDRVGPVLQGTQLPRPTLPPFANGDFLVSIVTTSFLAAFVARLFYASSRIGGFFGSIVLAIVSIGIATSVAAASKFHLIIRDAGSVTEVTAGFIIVVVILMFLALNSDGIVDSINKLEQDVSPGNGGSYWALHGLLLFLWVGFVSFVGVYLSFALLAGGL